MNNRINALIVLGCMTITSTIAQNNDSDFEKEATLAANNFSQYIQSKPAVFRKNMGQWDSDILFRTADNGTTVSFMNNGLSHCFMREKANYEGEPIAYKPFEYDNTQLMVWNVEFIGINQAYTPKSTGKTDSKTNYFLGNDPSKHATHVPDYRSIAYTDIYKGVDLRYYKSNGKLKYDYILQPSANIEQIKMRTSGVKNLNVNRKGELEINTPWGILTEKKPYSYQFIDGQVKEIDVRFELYDKLTYGFKAYGDYDPSIAIVIDPIVLDWGTYVGVTDVSARSYSFAAAKDNTGNIYVTGKVRDIITSPGAFDTTPNDNINDVFIIKLSADGSQMMYSTFFGGNNKDWGTGIAITSNGEAIVSGITSSADLPLQNAYQSQLNTTGAGAEADGFLVRINATGDALIYSTFFGGSGQDWPSGHVEDEAISNTIFPDSNFKFGNGLALNANGEAIITGLTTSANFPATTGSLQGTSSGFLVKFDASAGSMIHSEVFGGNSLDISRGVAINSLGDVLVVGSTRSTNFQTTDGTFKVGTEDIFIKRYFDNPGAAMTSVYSTLIGGSGVDYGISIDLNESGDGFVCGYTQSTNFGTIGSLQGTSFNRTDAFVMRVDGTGKKVWATYVGGNFVNEIATHIAVSDQDEAFITGYTESSDFPMVCAFDNTQKTDEGFLTKVDPQGNIEFSTYVGGDNLDYGCPRVILHEDGCGVEAVTISITTHSPESTFPTTPGSYYPNKLNNDNGIDRDHPAVVTLSYDYEADFGPTSACGSNTVNFKDLTSASGTCIWGQNWAPSSWTWDFGDGSSSTEQNPVHTYTSGGTYTVSLTTGCPEATITKQVDVSSAGNPINATTTATAAGCGQNNGTATVSASGGSGNFTYSWNDPSSQTGITATGLAPGNYTVIVTDQGGCQTTANVTVDGSTGITVNTSVVLDADCDRFGGTLGNATATPVGGNQPFTYQWDDALNQTTQTAVGLSPGVYNVIVTDVNGCSSNAVATVDEKIQLSFNVDVVPCEFCTDGQVTVIVNGTGKQPFTYRWDDDNEQTTATATGLGQGVYVVTVTDADGCFTRKTVGVGVIGIEDPSIDHLVTVYPNPNEGTFYVNLSQGLDVEAFRVYDVAGKLTQQLGRNGASVITFDIHKPGFYLLEIISTQGNSIKRIQVTE